LFDVLEKWKRQTELEISCKIVRGKKPKSDIRLEGLVECNAHPLPPPPPPSSPPPWKSPGWCTCRTPDQKMDYFVSVKKPGKWKRSNIRSGGRGGEKWFSDKWLCDTEKTTQL
jgi:hypothetical protein